MTEDRWRVSVSAGSIEAKYTAPFKEIPPGDEKESDEIPDLARNGLKTGSPLIVGYILKMFPRLSETFILNEILELERRGVHVVIFSMKKPNETIQQPHVADVKAPIYFIPPISGPAWMVHLFCHLRCIARTPFRYLRTLAFARSRGTESSWKKFLGAPYIACKARSLGVKHFHAHFAGAPTRQAKLASLISGIPFSFTAHARDLFWEGHQHGKNNKLKKRVRLASFAVTISEYNRIFIGSLNFKVPQSRVVTIHNGLDLSRWQFIRPNGRPLTTRGDVPPVVLAVARLVEKKGFHNLVEACKLLKEQGVLFRCVVAGEGPERERLETMIEEHDLKGCIHLIGSVSQDRLAEDLYTRAWVLVQPSVVAQDGDRDGIPMVVLESMAIGLPVVASDVAGMREVIQDGATGFLVPAGDTAGIASAVRRILEDDEMVRSIAWEGRRLIEKRFNLRQNVESLIQLMEKSARGKALQSEEKIRKK